MTDKELAREIREARRLERLRSNNPLCGECGEADSRCLELHHVADYGCDDGTVILCRNCHKKVTDDQKDHPAFDPDADPMLHSIGRFLLGLADLLKLAIEKLAAFGAALIERAALQTGQGIRP